MAAISFGSTPDVSTAALQEAKSAGVMSSGTCSTQPE